MKSNLSSWYLFIAVVVTHLGGIAFVVYGSSRPVVQPIVEPVVQGILVTPKKEEVLPEPPKPKPEPKPEPKKTKTKTKPKPIPKAPPSERAVKTEPLPQPDPIFEPEPVIEEEVAAPVIPPSSDAHQVQNPAPAYPQLSRKLKEEGTVNLLILVTAEGNVAEVKIKTSSGYKRLDDAAVKAVRRWRFVPASQAGVAIDYWYEIPFEFSLKRNS